jgi:hypothetical protein
MENPPLQQEQQPQQPPPILPERQLNDSSNQELDSGNNFSEQVKSSLDDFSSPEKTGISDSDFLQSNGMVANFAFLILVLIIFLVLLNLGIYALNYFMQPTSNPYIIYGTIQGNEFLTISRNPKSARYVVLQHSNNRDGGIEFTWSVWLNFNHINNPMKTEYSHLFSVGTNSFDSKTGLSTGNNGPGFYLRNQDESGDLVSTANILLLMDTMSLDPIPTNKNGLLSTETTTSTTEISKLPYNKWFHLACRMQFNSMDIYINGIISDRINFENVPRQNYEDVLLCANGGFNGQMSNLRYYNYALNVFEISNIVYWGPSLKAATNNNITASGNYNYLSNIWYLNKL